MTILVLLSHKPLVSSVLSSDPCSLAWIVNSEVGKPGEHQPEAERASLLADQAPSPSDGCEENGREGVLQGRSMARNASQKASVPILALPQTSRVPKGKLKA